MIAVFSLDGVCAIDIGFRINPDRMFPTKANGKHQGRDSLKSAPQDH